MSIIKQHDGRVDAAESFGYSPHQRADYIDPASLRPILDRVVLRDIPDQDKIGSLWIPDTAHARGMGKNGLLRMAQVVAVGPGDNCIQKLVKGKVVTIAFKREPGFHFPMIVKAGDLVLMDRRREAEIYVNDERFTIAYEQQAVYATLEGDPMKIRPLYDRIIVKRHEDPEGNKVGMLFIPDNAKEKPQRGVVVAVGDGKRSEEGVLIPLDIRVGDKVLFGKHSGADIKVSGEELLIMREDEVMARIAEAGV